MRGAPVDSDPLLAPGDFVLSTMCASPSKSVIHDTTDAPRSELGSCARNGSRSRPPLLERIFAGNFSAPTEKVRRLNLFIVFYLLTIGGLNLFVAYNYSTAEWMKFKYFGLTVLHFMFMIFCFYFLKPHVKEYLDKLIAEENGQKKL